MTKETPKVELAPELEQKVQADQEALVCVQGLVYITSIMLRAGKLPDFKQSLSIQLGSFLTRANLLRDDDFHDPQEVEQVIAGAKSWIGGGGKSLLALGVLASGETEDGTAYYDSGANKVQVRRSKEKDNTFIFNIGPYGKNQ